MSIYILEPNLQTPRMLKSKILYSKTLYYAWSDTHLTSLHKYDIPYVTSAIKTN